MTKFIDRTKSVTEKKKKKECQFVGFVSTTLKEIRKAISLPSEYAEVILIERNIDGFDLMLAIDENGKKCLYFGHANDSFDEE